MDDFAKRQTVDMASNDDVPLAADGQWVSQSNDVESPIMDFDAPGRAIGGIIDEMQRSAAQSPRRQSSGVQRSHKNQQRGRASELSASALSSSAHDRRRPPIGREICKRQLGNVDMRCVFTQTKTPSVGSRHFA